LKNTCLRGDDNGRRHDTRTVDHGGASMLLLAIGLSSSPSSLCCRCCRAKVAPSPMLLLLLRLGGDGAGERRAARFPPLRGAHASVRGVASVPS
jgi:hypothetical protein